MKKVTTRVKGECVLYIVYCTSQELFWHISGAGELSPVITNSTGSQPILKTKILEFSPTLITGILLYIADKSYPEDATRRLAPKNLLKLFLVMSPQHHHVCSQNWQPAICSTITSTIESRPSEICESRICSHRSQWAVSIFYITRTPLTQENQMN